MLSLDEILNDSYKNEYYKNLNRICAQDEVKSGIGFTIRELTKIVREVSQLSPEDVLMGKIQNAAETNDEQAFNDFIIAFGFHHYQPHFRKAYMTEISNQQPSNKEDLQAVINKVNSNIEAALENGIQGAILV